MPDSPNILIIGIGNNYRSDDGVGFLVIDRLQSSEMKNVHFIKMESDGYSLIEAWKNQDFVIIVDAAISGELPGTIRRFDALTERIPHDLSQVSTHSINLAETVSLAETLGQLPKRLTVFAIEAGSVDYGQELSNEVQKAADQVVHEITDLITSITSLRSSAS